MEPGHPSAASSDPGSKSPRSPQSGSVERCHPGTSAEDALPSPSQNVRKYRAFFCHAGPQKQSIVSFVLYAVDVHKKSSEVFYDERMSRESTYEDTLDQRIIDALYGSETLVVFLSWECLTRKWPLLEVKTFLAMMEREKTISSIL